MDIKHRVLVYLKQYVAIWFIANTVLILAHSFGVCFLNVLCQTVILGKKKQNSVYIVRAAISFSTYILTEFDC